MFPLVNEAYCFNFLNIEEEYNRNTEMVDNDPPMVDESLGDGIGGDANDMGCGEVYDEYGDGSGDGYEEYNLLQLNGEWVDLISNGSGNGYWNHGLLYYFDGDGVGNGRPRWV